MTNTSDFLSDLVDRAAEATSRERKVGSADIATLRDLGIVPSYVADHDVDGYVDKIRCWLADSYGYSARALPVPVIAFPAQDDRVDYPFRGWSSVIPSAGLQIVPAPGTHQSIIEYPHVTTLGALIGDSLRRPVLRHDLATG